MKMLLLTLAGFGIDRLLSDETLANVRQLVAAGCFGPLEPVPLGADLLDKTIAAQLAAVGAQALARDQGDEKTLPTLPAGDWEYLRLGLGPLAGEAADRRIGQILDLLDGETAVLILLGPAPATPDGFVLAAPSYPPLGELRDVTLPDLARTLLDMAGYTVPDTMPGRLLAARWAPDAAGGLSEDEEALLRARLEGLGYIG